MLLSLPCEMKRPFVQRPVYDFVAKHGGALPATCEPCRWRKQTSSSTASAKAAVGALATRVDEVEEQVAKNWSDITMAEMGRCNDSCHCKHVDHLLNICPILYSEYEAVGSVRGGDGENNRGKHLLFVGNPGAGKSCLLNGCIGAVEFQSGVSIATGMTTHLQWHEDETGLKFGDTPGLTDVEKREQAAAEISEALRQEGEYRLVFVVTLASGRVRPDDITTMCVCIACALSPGPSLLVNMNIGTSIRARMCVYALVCVHALCTCAHALVEKGGLS